MRSPSRHGRTTSVASSAAGSSVAASAPAGAAGASRSSARTSQPPKRQLPGNGERGLRRLGARRRARSGRDRARREPRGRRRARPPRPPGELASRQIELRALAPERHRAGGGAFGELPQDEPPDRGVEPGQVVDADRLGARARGRLERLGCEPLAAPRPPREARPASRRSSPRRRGRSLRAPASPRCGSGCGRRGARRWSGRRGREAQRAPPARAPAGAPAPAAAGSRRPRRGASPSSARRPGEVASR